MKRSDLAHNTHWLFWGAIPLLLVYLIITITEATDINIHDTYFVFPRYFLVAPLILLFYITGLGYFLSYKSEKFNPLRILTLLHIILFFVGLLLIIIQPELKATYPAENLDDMMSNIKIWKLNSNLKKIGIVSFLSSQLVLIINLTWAILRNK